MAEGTLKSYNPLAYYVNNVSDFDTDVVNAHRNKDHAKQEELLANERSKTNFDVFICVNKQAHAFVLCAPFKVDPTSFGADMISQDPFQIPEQLLCWRYELCFENQAMRLYKIRKDFAFFKDIKPKIDKSFYMTRYEGLNPFALQFAALRAAPHRYNALLNDCVEFSKEFCVCLLSYCSNWKTVEEVVNNRIKEVSATGLSIERLSRRTRSSGFLGNISLGGTDLSSLLSERKGIVIALVLFLIFVYPVVVAIFVAVLVKKLL